MVLMTYYFLFQGINGKLCLRYGWLNDIEMSIVDWFVFILAANVYFMIMFLWFFAYNEMQTQRNLMQQFPEYESIYKQSFRISLFFVIFFPIIYIGGGVLLYINTQYFRDMMYLLLMEGVFIFACMMFGLIVFIFLNVYRYFFPQRNPYLYDGLNDPINSFDSYPNGLQFPNQFGEQMERYQRKIINFSVDFLLSYRLPRNR